MNTTELVEPVDLRDRVDLAGRLAAQGHPARGFALALQTHEEAGRSFGHDRLFADSADCLADCCLKIARYELGISFARTARAVWQSLGDEVRVAGSTSRIAELLGAIGDPDSLGEAAMALDLAERSGNALELIRALQVNGVVLSMLKQADRSVPFSERAVALMRATGTRFPVATINLADVLVCAALQARERGQPDTLPHAVARALALSRDALEEARADGDGWLERLALNNIAEYSIHIGDTDTAAAALAAYGAAPGEPTPRCQSFHLLVRGRVLRAAGFLDEAIDALRAAQGTAGREYIEVCGPCAEQLADALAQRGDYREALAAFREFHELYVRQASEAAQRRARVYAVQKELEALRDAAAQSQTLATNLAESNKMLEREAERLRRTSFEDPLTGLSNRRHLEAHFIELGEDARRYAFALIDADHFKSINDNFSHQVGDLVLRTLGRVLAANARAHDLVARYGGEEFAVLMRDVDHAQALFVCERLCCAVREADWSFVEPGFTLTVSIGLAASDEAPSLDGVIARADSRLYAAKRRGRDRVVATDAPARQVDDQPILSR